MRVFLDANVLFSASNPGGIINRLIEQAMLRVTLISNSFVETEARRNLLLKRPDWIATFEHLLKNTKQSTVAVFDLPIDLAQKDQPVLCSAIRSNCRYLVTGDRRDFGHLYGQTIEDLTVISPGKFAKILEEIPKANR